MSSQFDVCWMNQMNGLQWVELVGGALILYCYCLTTTSEAKGYMWRTLLACGVSGICGILMETAFAAANDCGNTDPNLAYIIAFNEINWIIHEVTVVLYSLFKSLSVITNHALKNSVYMIMAVLGVIFAALRINIGVNRFKFNMLGNHEISVAHSWAFISWGIADLVIIVLLVMSTLTYMKNDAGSNIGGAFKTILTSSIPRIFVIFINTICIVIVGQFMNPSPTLSNFNHFLWWVKGTYPLIMLIDILLTKDLLMKSKIARESSNGTRSHPSTSVMNHSANKH
ncbi:hypothetical protein HDU78_002951 [Chytriomyces hyalinus]|nr:hypothetical protein HDU78_002951 [Chytriomyces hyalinus]